MQYMFLIHTDETAVPAPGTAEFDQWLGGWIAYNQQLVAGGNWIDGGSLMPTSTSTTVKIGSRPGQPAIVDGPFSEAKEQFGGYYVVEAADLDEALALAARIPLGVASVEVRPVAARALGV